MDEQKFEEAEKYETKQSEAQQPVTISQERLDQIDRAGREASDVKKDFMLIFGIFASVVAFLTVEVDIFKIAKTPNQVLGLSCFIIAALLSFSISLKSILANSWQESLRVYAQPTTAIVILLLLAATHLLGK